MKTCNHTGKRCFTSKRHAHDAVRSLHARVRVYWCGHCKHMRVANAGKG